MITLQLELGEVAHAVQAGAKLLAADSAGTAAKRSAGSMCATQAGAKLLLADVHIMWLLTH